MDILRELMVTAAVATDEALGRALDAMKGVVAEKPFMGHISMKGVCARYGVSRNTVYRRKMKISKRIGGEIYFREEDVVAAFDPCMSNTVES